MKTFLAIDFGSGHLKMAEFEAQANGMLKLHRYVLEPMQQPPEPEVEEVAEGEEPKEPDPPDPFAGIKLTLQKALDENEIRAKGKEANFCMPSSVVFTKPLRTPPVEGSKVSQIIQYEAQQNVPFPLDEVQWDYQVLGSADSGELEVLLVALKTEVVEAYADLSRSFGMKLQLIDGSAATLRNAFVHNYGEPEECALLLDIGAATTNAVFIEGSMFYARSINMGSNNITQEFAAEAQLDFPSADQYKRDHGFVHLGGAYEDPQDPYQAIVAKVARNVMTRLHQQVSQTIQFYRSQQGGTMPTRLYLAGGGSLMPYTANFFQQKLNIEVEYFNPFRNIEIAPEVNREELAVVAHTLGEAAGLGLRNVTVGMTEFNLLPTREKVSREIDRRAPYLIAVVFCAALLFAVFGAYDMSMAKVKEEASQKIKENMPDGLGPIKAKVGEIESRISDFNSKKSRAEAMQVFLQSRYEWVHLLTALREAISRIEPHVKITAYFDPADKKQILPMDEYPGEVGGDDISVLPWRAVRVDGNSTLSLTGNMFEGGEPVQFRGRLPVGVDDVNKIYFVGTAGVDEPGFTLHEKEEDANNGENPVVFTEFEQLVGIDPNTHLIYWRGHPLVRGNAVRFEGNTPTVPREFEGDDLFYVKNVPGQPGLLELYSDPELAPESRVRFADAGVPGKFGLEPENPVEAPEPVTDDTAADEPPDLEENPDGEAKPKPPEPPKPRVNLSNHLIFWANHGLEDKAAIRFKGSPNHWPRGLESLDSDTLYFVEPRDSNWVRLHTGRELNETTRVIFSGLPLNVGFNIRAVPGEYTLDAPRGDGQEVNPQLVGPVAAALDKVVQLGGSYALDPDTDEVMYVGLVGPGVRRDSVRQPELEQLAVLRNLKYLEVWRDPTIPEKDWPEYQKLLLAFSERVKDCSISLAIPTTLWVTSFGPGVAQEELMGAEPGGAPGEAAAVPMDEGNPEEISGLRLKIKAMNFKKYYTIANSDFVEMVIRSINAHPYFGGDPESGSSTLVSPLPVDMATTDMFFEFEVHVPLLEPIVLKADLDGAEALNNGEEGPGAGEEQPGAEPAEPGKEF